MLTRIAAWDPLLKLSALSAAVVLTPHARELWRAAPGRGRRDAAVLLGVAGALVAWRSLKSGDAKQEKEKEKDGDDDDGEIEVGRGWFAMAAVAALLVFFARSRARKARAPTRLPINLRRLTIDRVLSHVRVTHDTYTAVDASVSLFVALSGAPSLANLIANGSGDVPACLAMALGLLLGHAKATAVTLLMVTGGEALEDVAMERAGTAIESLLHRNPGTARLESGTDAPAESIEPGTRIIVRANETIPLDGTLISPSKASVNEQLITGEPLPSTKQTGGTLYAGTVNLTPTPILIKTTAAYSSTVFAQMKSTLRLALSRKSKIELSSKRIADALTPLTLFASTAAFLVSHTLRGQPPSQGWDAVLSVLMSATPCPAAIGVPVAMLSGMSNASRNLGTTIKSGDALEALADARIAVFDKTGTLTFGRPAVVEFLCPGDKDARKETGRLLASLEKMSKHVLADAVVTWYSALHPSEAPDLAVQEFAEEGGRGVSGLVELHGVWRSVKVGTAEFCGIEGGVEGAEELSEDTLRAYFSVSSPSSQPIQGLLAFSDPIHPSAHTLISHLRSLGVQSHILSGDRSPHLALVARQLGADGFASCLPHEKAGKVRELQKQGKVAFIGDGANDAPALAMADVGISVDSTSLSSDAASVVILSGSLSQLPGLISLASRSVNIARRTVTFGTLASLAQMVLAVAGVTTPVQNSAMQEVVDLSAVLYSMTAII